MLRLPPQRDGNVSLCPLVNHGDEVARITALLEDAAASLGDLAMSVLQEALQSGAGERPELEKRVSQARRAVEKALQHLANGGRAISSD